MSELVALGGQVPAYLRSTAVVAAGGPNTDFGAPIGMGPKFPKLSIKQSKWRIVRGKDDEEVIHQPHLDVVVVAANTGMYKTYYDKPYSPGQDATPPTCWSADGVVPSSFVAESQAKSCATCPKNRIGAKINASGKKVKACSDNKRVLVLAPDAIDGDFYMLNMPVMTLAAWNAYLGELTRHDVPVTGVITRISFDTTVEYPKLEFKFVGWLDEASYGRVNERMHEDDVAQFRGGTIDTEGTDGSAEPPEGVTDVTPVQVVAAPAVAAPKPAVVQAAPVQAAPVQAAPTASVSPLARGRAAKPKAQAVEVAAPVAIPVEPPADEGGDALDAEVASILEGF